jgi:hypothetical protein
MSRAPPQGTSEALQRILGVEDFKGVLKRIAPPAIHRGIDLNVAPGEHQQGGPEPIDLGQQHPLHIEHGQGRQIKKRLGESREALMQVIGQINGTDRKDRIAGQAHEQHPLTSSRALRRFRCQRRGAGHGRTLTISP